MLKALVRGGGDLASGVALSLHFSGFSIVMTELPEPTVIRRSVAFAEAVFQGNHTVEGIRADLATSENYAATLRKGRIAVLVDPEATIRSRFQPDVLIDAILAKRNLGTRRNHAPIVIGLGPGFRAGVDVDAVIETMRGHDLGRVIFDGTAMDDTGVPGEIGGKAAQRVLRAPETGRVLHAKRIGDLVEQGETVMSVGGAPVAAPFAGCLRGLIADGIVVPKGLKIGDLDPRGESRYCEVVSDKARALGRAALEATFILGRRSNILEVRRNQLWEAAGDSSSGFVQHSAWKRPCRSGESV